MSQVAKLALQLISYRARVNFSELVVQQIVAKPEYYVHVIKIRIEPQFLSHTVPLCDSSASLQNIASFVSGSKLLPCGPNDTIAIH